MIISCVRVWHQEVCLSSQVLVTYQTSSLCFCCAERKTYHEGGGGGRQDHEEEVRRKTKTEPVNTEGIVSPEEGTNTSRTRSSVFYLGLQRYSCLLLKIGILVTKTNFLSTNSPVKAIPPPKVKTLDKTLGAVALLQR